MNVIVIGPKGKMGRLITKAAASMKELTLVAGVASEGREYIGKDLGQVAMLGEDLGVPVVDDLESVIWKCDVIIDFSRVEVSLQVLQLAKQYKKALVCGTTGFSKEEMEGFFEAAQVIPMLYAANTSKLIHTMHELLKVATQVVGGETDIEILEMHDRWKKDAPSGTSKEMGELIAEELGLDFESVARYGRKGEREEGTIGYHSLRAGNIPSSHTVYFGGLGERLEITHHAYDWTCFANGACDCAVFLKGKTEGFYTVKDVLGLAVTK